MRRRGGQEVGAGAQLPRTLTSACPCLCCRARARARTATQWLMDVDCAFALRTLNDAGAAPDSDRHGNGPVEKRPRTQGSPGHDQEDVEDGSDHSFFCATLKRGGIDVRGLSKLGAGGQADGANAVPTFVNAAASAASVRQVRICCCSGCSSAEKT